MAPNPNGNLHDDPWMTDAYNRPGPLGRRLQASSSAMPAALCGSLTFDSAGRILSVCPSIANPVSARVIDSKSSADHGELRARLAEPHRPDRLPELHGRRLLLH